jgi:hypothetical protein
VQKILYQANFTKKQGDIVPQSRLPDINTAFIRYRGEAINALIKKNYNVMHGALNGINSLLPVDYQVVISSNDYDQLAKTEITYQCNGCKEYIDKSKIHVFELIPNSIETLVHGRTPNKVWNCTKCKHTNMLSSTSISQTILQNPTFLGIVPDPPTRTNGLMDRMKFNIEIERWGWLLLNELEFKMAKYRDDNWNKGDEEMGEIDTSLDDKEGGL